MKKKIIVGVVLLAMVWVLVGWVQERRQCKLRDVAYRERISRIQGVADGMLKVGASREDVLHFFSQIGMKPAFDELRREASSSLYLRACSPGWYCGDSALVGVRVKFDVNGRVESHEVGGIYTNCL
jgi:hypothetical protein